MKKILFASFSLVILFAPQVLAQDVEDLKQNMLGLTCDKILAMKPGSWADYHSQKTGNGSEVEQDIAFGVYGECYKRRNDTASAKLPSVMAQRINKYRELYSQYRIASTYLQQAYAGGGTLYSHVARRSIVEDEELVAVLIKLYRQGKPVPTGTNKNIQNRITRLRSQLRQLDPATSNKRGELVEFGTTKQAQSEYAAMQKNFNAIVAMLQKERSDASQVILKYVYASTNAFN
jgi:hypothetical protein